MELRLIEVTHRYGGQTALDQVSLHVRPRDCYGFLGHNGAGKTTAMRVALGLVRPRAGRVLVDGFDARRHPAEARARMGGLIETPGFHGGLSGLANLVLLARLQGIAGRRARSEAGRVLEAVGLAEVADKNEAAYSHGMRQRLGIAQALLGSPPIVLLDEPTNGLDPDGIEEMRRLLLRLTREEGTTVLVSSHQLHELAGICNRVAILRQGRLLVEQEIDELVGGSRYELRAGDPERAAAVLRGHEEGVVVREPGDGTLLVDTDGRDTAALLEALVAGGARPLSFAPRPTTLEDVYLRLTRGAELPPAHAPSAPPPPAATAAPHVRRARRGAMFRMVRHEFRRFRSSWGVAVALALPAVAAAGAVLLRKAEAGGFAAEVEEGMLATTTDVTAFEGVGVALRTGVPVLAFVAAGLASQALAGELSRGTLRNVLLRPLRRMHVALGKAAGGLLATLLAYLLLVGTSLGVAALCFDFTDVTEILFNGERFPLVAAEELWEPLRLALAAPLPALLACAGLGFLAGALTRGPAAALGSAFALIAVPDLGRSVLRGFEMEWTVPTAHLPTPLGDHSYVAHYLDLARGVSNTRFEAGTAAWAVPAAWLAVCLLVGTFVLCRRSVR